MNKRQAKKQFKKQHGYNPTSAKRLKAAERQTLAQFGLTEDILKANLRPEEIAAAAEAVTRAFTAAAKAIAAAGEAIRDAFTKAAENLESEE